MTIELTTVSAIIGWIYVIGWGVANYPTILHNRKCKSVEGISMDYLFFNMMGFVLYTTYTSCMIFNSIIREEFYLENGEWPLIKVNDLIFGVHNLLTNGYMIIQAYCLGYSKKDSQKVSIGAKVIIGCVISYIIIGLIIIYHKQGWGVVIGEFNLMKLVTYMGLIKIGMSVCKNIPQIIYNFERKSTNGWPVLMIWFDFFGASMSLIQLIIDALVVNDIMNIFDNKPKLFLAVQVIIADSIFFLQHYYLYYDEGEGYFILE